MKYTLRIMFLLMCPLLIQAQDKKTNTIEVKNATLTEGVKQLLAQGYLIDKIDTVYGFVYSKPKTVKGNSVVINLTQKDSALLVTGTIDMNMEFNLGGVSTKSTAYPISFKGQKGSPMRKCWEALDRFAKSLGKEVTYSTR